MNWRLSWLAVLLMIQLAGPIGCATQFGRYPCEANECFGHNLWQKALDQIAAKNFPDSRFVGQIYADKLDNAWTTQGNQVYITSSLMLKLDQRSDLHVLAAAAHEIAHLRSHHSLAKAGMMKGGSEKKLTMEERHSEVSTDAAVAALSRRQELEADALAVQYLSRLGYTKEDYLKFLKWMDRNLEAPPPSALATHPTPQDRMEHIRRLEITAE